MKVKFEAMESSNLSGMLNEDGKSARMVGKFKGSKVFTFTFKGSKAFTFFLTFTFKGSKVKTVVDVLCLPLFTLLAALDFPTVDFFSLDVEGAELGILQTIPWHQV